MMVTQSKLKMEIGFVGVGNIGFQMAKTFLVKGFKVIVNDINQSPVEELAQIGAQVAKNAKAVGEKSNFVFITVLDGRQVKKVVLGRNGLLGAMNPGSTIICCSTIFPHEIQKIASTVEKKGIGMVDCPVSGGSIRASEGTLTLMVASKKNIFEDCKKILQVVGRDIYHVGEAVGMGQIVKASHQVLVAATYLGMIEALILGTKAGIRPEIIFEVLSSGSAGSFLFRNRAKLILERNFRAGGRLTQLYKDLNIIMQIAKDCNVPLFSTAVSHEMFKAAKAIVPPEEDSGAIVKVLEKIVGIEIKKEESDLIFT